VLMFEVIRRSFGHLEYALCYIGQCGWRYDMLYIDYGGKLVLAFCFIGRRYCLAYWWSTNHWGCLTCRSSLAKSMLVAMSEVPSSILDLWKLQVYMLAPSSS
jgi:hypothetical protein